MNMNPMAHRFARMQVAWMLSLLLMACGGGGGSPAAAPVTPHPPPVVDEPVSPALATNLGSGAVHKVVMDDAGNAIAIWGPFGDEAKHQPFEIGTRRYTPAGGWGPVEILSNPEGVPGAQGTAKTPRIAMHAASGAAMATWVQVNPASGEKAIWARPFQPDTGWGTPALVDTSGAAGEALAPEIAFSASGEVFAIWLRKDATNGLRRAAWANRYASGAWDLAPVQLNKADGDVGEVNVAVNGLGGATAVWTQFSEPNNNSRLDLFSSFLTPGDNWQLPQLVENDDGGDVFSPQVAIDDDGRSIVVWHQERGFLPGNPNQAHDLRVSISTPEGGWGVHQHLNSTPTLAFEPNLVLDRQRNAMVVWTQFSLLPPMDIETVWVSRLALGEPHWSVARRLDQNPIGYASGARMAVDGEGNAVVTWEERDARFFDVPTQGSVVFRRFNLATGWTAPTLLRTTPTGDFVQSPEVTMNASGTAVAHWLEVDINDVLSGLGGRPSLWAESVP